MLPVVISATQFGWGPALAATVAGVLAFDFFFTQPYFSFTIASPADIFAAVLLFVIAGIVSAVAADLRRKALEARRAAEEAQALQALAHGVIQSRPENEIAEAAAMALNRIFRAPAAVFREQEGTLELVARAGVVRVAGADEDAARASAAAHVPTRAGAYPVEAATFDFWPVAAKSGRSYVLGIDFSQTAGGRPPAPERPIELVGAYLAGSARGKSTVAA